MAVDRQRLAEALAYGEQKRRMMESVPTVGNLPPTQPARRSLRTDLENLSSGIGQGIANQMEGVKGLITDPIGTVKGAYEGVKGIVRDPSVLADALRYTADKAMSGPLGAGEVVGEMLGPMRGKPPMAEIDVYHGSPHRFEEFDASKIGTGEGAQAFGHGIYLAESPDVAKDYATRLWKNKYPAGRSEAWDASAKFYKAQKKYLQSVLDNAPKETKEALKNQMDVALEGIEKAKREVGPQFYTADLPDEMVDRMLDWDKPLSEQSPSVLAALEKSKNKQIRAMLEYAKTPYTGAGIEGETKTMGEAYRTMSMNLSGRANAESAKASKLLQQAGIPGVRYLDAGSRGQGGSGTRNFVVFPGEEKKVKILKRE